MRLPWFTPLAITAGKIDIVAAAAAHQHELQRLLSLQSSMYAFFRQGKARNIKFAPNTPVESASSSKMLMFMAYKYVLRLGAVNRCVLRLRAW